jgi:hypothetical protein
MIAQIFDYIASALYVFALIFCWKDINARYLILSILSVSLIGFATLDWAFAMPIGFYAWSMGMSGLFIIFMLGRRHLAYRLSHIEFFAQAYKNHTYTVQEALLYIIALICILSNFITFVEVYLYSIYWLDNAYYKLYIRDGLQKLMIILTSFVCLSFTIKSWAFSKTSLNEQ